jgi:hypothetical protein
MVIGGPIAYFSPTQPADAQGDAEAIEATSMTDRRTPQGRQRGFLYAIAGLHHIRESAFGSIASNPGLDR